VLLEFLIALGILTGCVWSVPTACGWGEQGWETDNYHTLETTPKNAHNPSHPVHTVLDSVCWLTSPSEKIGNSDRGKTSDLDPQCLYIRLLR